MYIDDRNVSNPLASQIDRTRETKRVGSSKTASGSGSSAASNDDVSISPLASQAAQVLAGGQQVRAERIDRLTLEVQSGQYKVDSMAVSRALVDEALQATGMDRGAASL